MIENERIILFVERQDVHPGDFLDLQRRKFAFKIDVTIGEAITAIVKSGYLPAGLNWVVEFGPSIAVVAHKWATPKFLIDSKSRVSEIVPANSRDSLFFRLLSGDPLVYFEDLSLGQPFAED